jgi:hypothetical protein
VILSFGLYFQLDIEVLDIDFWVSVLVEIDVEVEWLTKYGLIWGMLLGFMDEVWMVLMAEIWGFDWCILVVEILIGLVIYWYGT